ncbi:hypothetical protein TNCV_1531331 [Trichonephila clavipes]|nr:hypothetical protein TNCV_1531331 [Trichonephila clavipes]
MPPANAENPPWDSRVAAEFDETIELASEKEASRKSFLFTERSRSVDDFIRTDKTPYHMASSLEDNVSFLEKLNVDTKESNINLGKSG